MRNLIVSLATAAIVATTAPAVHAAPTLTAAPACEYEDGSSQSVCVWNARQMGNGIGQSFVIHHGGTNRTRLQYVSHKRAAQLIRNWTAR